MEWSIWSSLSASAPWQSMVLKQVKTLAFSVVVLLEGLGVVFFFSPNMWSLKHAYSLLENPLLLWIKFNIPLETLDYILNFCMDSGFLVKNKYAFLYEVQHFCPGGLPAKTAILLFAWYQWESFTAVFTLVGSQNHTHNCLMSSVWFFFIAFCLNFISNLTDISTSTKSLQKWLWIFPHL